MSGLADLFGRHRPATLVHGAAVTSGPSARASAPATSSCRSTSSASPARCRRRAGGVGRIVHQFPPRPMGGRVRRRGARRGDAQPAESLYSITKFAGSAALRLGQLWGVDVRVAADGGVQAVGRDTGVRDTEPVQATAAALRREEAVLDRPVCATESMSATWRMPAGAAQRAVGGAGRHRAGREWSVACWCGLLAEQFPASAGACPGGRAGDDQLATRPAAAGGGAAGRGRLSLPLAARAQLPGLHGVGRGPPRHGGA
jgi:hypothetical protein